MYLKGVNFGPIWGGSGVQNFFGNGYPFHKILGPFEPDFSGMTFVAKTTTLEKREGNMPLLSDGSTPKEFFPKCIIVKWWRNAVLNAVGLSGFGAKFLFETGYWQKMKKPFFISFMAVGRDSTERLLELKCFVSLFKSYLKNFSAPVGLQLNYSCPNTGHDLNDLVHEVSYGIEIASQLSIPIVPKFNVLLPVHTALEICEHKRCDAITISNTIPWGQLGDMNEWESFFGTKESPLKEFGGGGLSGAPLLKTVASWVHAARKAGFYKPINAGGGILEKDHIDLLKEAGASSVSIASVAILRPWRVQGIIRRAYEVFSEN